MNDATLAEALEEIETTQRKNSHLLEAGRLKPETHAYKQRRLARAHKAITFLIANEDWILDIHRSRERIKREQAWLCEEGGQQAAGSSPAPAAAEQREATP